MTEKSDLHKNRLKKLDYFQKRNTTNLSHTFSIESGQKGAHVVMFGAVHGREPAGVEAAIIFNEYLHQHNLNLKNGKITFVIGNPEAFLLDQRFIHQNLNRVFFNNLQSTSEGIRAEQIRNYLQSTPIDYLLDVHSQYVGDMRMIIYNNTSFNFKTALQISNLPTHLLADEINIPGTLICEAEKYGISSFGLECGNNTKQETIESALGHLVYTLSTLNIIDISDFEPLLEHYQKPSTIKRYYNLQPIRPATGFEFLIDYKQEDCPIKAGQEYVKDTNGTRIAVEDCVLLWPDPTPSMSDHDAGFLANIEWIDLQKPSKVSNSLVKALVNV